MATSKKTSSPKTSATGPDAGGDVAPKHVGTGQGESLTEKVSFDRVKEAIPSMDRVAGDVQDFAKEHANVDLQRLADDATNFVRRNPGTSLAAAAGLGVLIGLLVYKRS